MGISINSGNVQLQAHLPRIHPGTLAIQVMPRSYTDLLIHMGAGSQTLPNPRITEYTLNYSRIPNHCF